MRQIGIHLHDRLGGILLIEEVHIAVDAGGTEPLLHRLVEHRHREGLRREIVADTSCELRRAIRGAVINDEHFELDALHRAGRIRDAVEQTLHVGHFVVCRHDDGQLHRGIPFGSR